MKSRRLDRSLAQRGEVERPSLDELPAFGGEKVSPLRAFGAPVETTEVLVIAF
jgi:hypothetical protein